MSNWLDQILWRSWTDTWNILSHSGCHFKGWRYREVEDHKKWITRSREFNVLDILPPPSHFCFYNFYLWTILRINLNIVISEFHVTSLGFKLNKFISLFQISYAHIKTTLVMQNLGISPELILPSCPNTLNADQLPDICHMEGPCEVETSANNSMAPCSFGKNEETASVPSTGGQGPKLSLVHDEDALLIKRQKVSGPEKGSLISLKATESSIVDWLKNYDEGVSWMEDPNLCYSWWKAFLCSLFCTLYYVARPKNTLIWMYCRLLCLIFWSTSMDRKKNLWLIYLVALKATFWYIKRKTCTGLCN